MKSSKLIRKILMYCPICDKVHEIEERVRTANITIKGKEAVYEEIYYLCHDCNEEENEFATGKMENENLSRAREAYKQANDDVQ